MQTDRPIIKLPYTSTEKIIEVVAALGLLASIAVVLHGWSSLPSRIPTHVDFSGKPNGWGPKGTLFIIPGLALALYVLLTIGSRFPHTFNYPMDITPANAPRLYRIARSLFIVTKCEMVWLFAYIEWVTIRVALGETGGLGLLSMPMFLVAIIGTVVISIIAMRRAA